MRIRYAVPALAAATALVLTGCTNDDGAGTEETTGGAEIAADDAAVALLPDAISESGTLRLATDADYPPNEFKDQNGDPVGWGVELAEAVAAKLGLEPEWSILSFDSILPQIEEDGVDVGASSFTDTVERQATVDFVNYYNAGTLWAAPTGETVDPENACGLKVAVQSGTVQHTHELPQRSEKCVEDGESAIEILPFDGQPEATNAVVLGQADAFSADSPVTIDAVNKLDGEIEIQGELFDAAPYGFAIKKDSELSEAVQAAVQSLMDDGTYLEILENAGAETGAIDEATINAGTE